MKSLSIACWAIVTSVAFAGDAPKKDPPPSDLPTTRTTRTIEGWTVKVDDRLLRAPNEEERDRLRKLFRMDLAVALKTIESK